MSEQLTDGKSAIAAGSLALSVCRRTGCAGAVAFPQTGEQSDEGGTLVVGELRHHPGIDQADAQQPVQVLGCDVRVVVWDHGQCVRRGCCGSDPMAIPRTTVVFAVAVEADHDVAGMPVCGTGGPCKAKE